MKERPLMLFSWPTCVMHLDGDAFFASIEQAINPKLKGKPVITGKERGIVAALSYEAKSKGVKRGMRLFEARKACPDSIILPNNYETYSIFSKRMFSIVKRYTPAVEESSIDEGYADLKGLRRIHRASYKNIARTIKRDVEKELNITISIGVSLTKTLAKICAKFRKPSGLTAVPGKYIHILLKITPLENVCGFGPNTVALLKKYGVNSALDFINRDIKWVKKTLGKTGIELYQELRGEKVYEVNPNPKTMYKSISKTKTFTPPSKEKKFVWAHLVRNCESAFIKAKRHNLAAKSMAVFLKEQDFTSSGVEIIFSRPINIVIEAMEFLEKAFKGIFKKNSLYRATGVVLGRLQDDYGLQYSLFENTLRVEKIKKLSDVITKINQRYGKHSLKIASTIPLNERRGSARNDPPQRKKTYLKGKLPEKGFQYQN